jgi:hypothetical protein
LDELRGAGSDEPAEGQEQDESAAQPSFGITSSRPQEPSKESATELGSVQQLPARPERPTVIKRRRPGSP